MKKIALALSFLAFASSAHAQQRPYTPAMSCGQAQQIVLSYGAVVLGTGTHTYDRYVRDGRFCLRNEFPELSWVPTRDTPQCPVGYRCVTDPPFEIDSFFDP